MRALLITSSLPQLGDLNVEPQPLVLGGGWGRAASLLGLPPVEEGVETKEGGVSLARTLFFVLLVNGRVLSQLKQVQHEVV